MATSFDNKCKILAELWMAFRDEEDFKEFIKYNDVSLPLAYFIYNEIVTDVADKGVNFIEETWEMLMTAMDFHSETEWESFAEIIDAVNERDGE